MSGLRRCPHRLDKSFEARPSFAADLHTPGYIAPEVFAYGTTKARVGYGIPADIWSTGATLYQVSTQQSKPSVQVLDAGTCPVHAVQQQAGKFCTLCRLPHFVRHRRRAVHGCFLPLTLAGLLPLSTQQMLAGSVVTDKPEEVLKKGWRPPTHPQVRHAHFLRPRDAAACGMSLVALHLHLFPTPCALTPHAGSTLTSLPFSRAFVRFSPSSPSQFSRELQDLLNRLLAPKPNHRPQGVASVMRHPWFAGFDWAALRAGRMLAPYVPSERRGANSVGPRRTHTHTETCGAPRQSLP